MSAYPAGTNLSTIVYTTHSDRVKAEATDPASSTGLFNDGSALLLGGGDKVGVRLTLTDAFTGGPLTGLNNVATGTLDTGAGDDQLSGKIRGVLGDSFGARLVGVSNAGAIAIGTGSDAITGSVVLSVGAGFFSGVSGLRNTGTIDTGAGGDSVDGVVKITGASVGGVGAVFLGIDGGTLDALNPKGVINTGAGRDDVTGRASVQADNSDGAIVIGIDDANINTGAGNDWVGGHAKIDVGVANNDISAAGIDGFANNPTLVDQSIVTYDAEGDGRDEIQGTAWARSGGGVGNLSAYGNSGMAIDTGANEDLVGIEAYASGVGTISTAYGATTNTAQTSDIVIKLGAGGDAFDATAYARNTTATAFGIAAIDLQMDNGAVDAGKDWVTLGAKAYSVTSAAAYGAEDAVISLGAGSDGLEISARGRATDALGVAQVYGLDETQLVGGTGSDWVRIKAKAEAPAGDSFAAGINDSDVNLDDLVDLLDGGDDTLIVNAYGKGFASANGISFSTVNSGVGDDVVKAEGYAEGENGADVRSVGVATSSIILGDGEDFLLARGQTAGVYQTTIDGGAGDDRIAIYGGFSYQDGASQQSIVDGGADDDTLILTGDFTWSRDATTNVVTFTANEAGNDGDTLVAQNVEHFVLNGANYDVLLL